MLAFAAAGLAADGVLAFCSTECVGGCRRMRLPGSVPGWLVPDRVRPKHRVDGHRRALSQNIATREGSENDQCSATHRPMNQPCAMWARNAAPGHAGSALSPHRQAFHPNRTPSDIATLPVTRANPKK